MRRTCLAILAFALCAFGAVGLGSPETGNNAEPGPNCATGETPRGETNLPSESAHARLPTETLTRWVAKVDGDPISVALFERRLAANRSAAYLRFTGTKPMALDETFWTTERDGQTPAAWLKQRTLKDCVRIKVELGLGKRYGLIPDTSYAAFLKALDRENERRRVALARGEPIYGPEQYGEREFFVYVMSNLRLAVANKLAEEVPPPSEEELREFYETVKGEHFRLDDEVKIQGIKVTPKGTESAAQAAARTRLEEARKRLESGDDIHAVAAEYDDEGKVRQWTFGPAAAPIRTRWRAELRDTALAMHEGELRQLTGMENALYLMKCVERRPSGHRPFEQVKDAVALLHLQRKYEDMVDKRVKSARVEINQVEWDRIEVK